MTIRQMNVVFAISALAGLTAPNSTALAQSSGVSPGQWEIAVTIDSMTMQGAPAGIAQMMVGKTTRVKHCLTPTEAARGPQDLIRTDKSCVFSRYAMTGGKLSSEMACKRGGGAMTTSSSGSFTATGFTVIGRSASTGAMPMTMTATSIGRRIGAC